MSGGQIAAAPADLTAQAGPSWEYEDAPQNDNTPSSVGRSALSPRQIAALLAANARRIALLSLALFVLGIALLLVIPAKYTATSLVLIDPREQKITNEQDVLPGIGQDAAALQSVIEIAKSDGFLRPLIERLNVAADPEISGGETNIAQLLARFRTRLDVSRRGLTYVVAFSFTSSDANKAAYYANAIAEAFITEQAKTRSLATQQASEWLSNRLTALRDQLTKSEDAVAAFKTRFKIIDAGKDSTLRQVRATDLTQQASLAKLRAEEAKTRYDQIIRDLRSNVDTSTGSRSELLSALRAQRTQLNDQIAQKRAVLGDRHPDVIISLTQRDQLERQIETERRQILQAAKSDYETLRAQQKQFEDLLNSSESEMLSTSEAAVKLQDLQRQVDANRSIYEQFLSRYKTTNEQRSMQTEQTRMVSTATVPARPNRPSLSILIAGIAAASMIFSTLGVVLYEASGHQFLTRTTAKPAAPVSADTTAPAVTTAAPVPREAGKPSGAPPSPLDLPVWAVVPIQNPTLSHQSARQIENPLTDMLESIALTRTVRGKVVLFLSGNVRQGRPVIAEALSSLAVERGMLSFLAQLEVEHPEGVVSMQNRFVQTNANTVRATIRSLLLLFAGPSASDASSKSDIRTEFDIIVVDGTAIRNPVEIQGLASYIDYAVFLVNDTQQPVDVSEAMRALAGNSSIITGVVVDQAAA